MKKVSLISALLLLHHITICQIVKPLNLKDFEGKKIVSLFKSTTEVRGGWPGIYIAPTNQYQTVKRSITFQKTESNNIFVQKIISNVNIDSENMTTSEHRIFDTDRKFDRTDIQSTVYGVYDHFINKPFKNTFDNQGKRNDTLTNFKTDNSYFMRAWGDDKLPFLQDHFLGFLQMSLPTETIWKVGQTWENMIKRENGAATKNEIITNTYTVKSINDDIVIIELKGVKIPGLVMYNKADGYVTNTLKNSNVTSNANIKYTVEQKATYEGIIKLDSKINFIQMIEIKMNEYKKIFMKDSPTSGPEDSFIVTIENKLEDLK